MEPKRKQGRSNIRHRHILVVALSGLIAVALLASSAAPTAFAAKDVVSFRMGHNEPIGSPMNNAFEEWVKVLKKRSNGRLKPANFPAGQTGNYTQNIEANRMGTIEVCAGGLDTEGKVSPVTSVLGLGYVVNSYKQVDKVFQGPLGKVLSEEMKKKTGVYVIAWGEAGFRNILSKKPIRKLGDLKGKKIRVPESPINLRLFQLLGGNPVPVAYAEMYTALQTGVVDAAEGTIPDTLGFKFYEPTGHISFTGHQFNVKAIRVNARWFDSLPPDLQKIFSETAKEVFANQRKLNRQGIGGAIEKMKSLGVKFYEVDKGPWIKVGEKHQDEYAKQYPEAAGLINKVRALK
jgi:tripartite ATP-independent transporter DctP family solute receptor